MDKQLFEWVNENQGLPIKYPACIRYDGGGAYVYDTACSDADIIDNNNIVEWLKPVSIISQDWDFVSDKFRNHWNEVNKTEYQHLSYNTAFLSWLKENCTVKTINLNPVDKEDKVFNYGFNEQKQTEIYLENQELKRSLKELNGVIDAWENRV